MALGVDTIFAITAIELKQAGYNIRFVAAIPFAGQEKMWPETSQTNYKNILTWADEKIIVCSGGYEACELSIT